MKTTDVDSKLTAKNGGLNGAQKSAKEVIDNAIKDAPEVIQKVTDFGKDLLNSVSASKDKTVDAAVASLNSLDKALKSRPWVFAGGVAVLGFAVGYFIARNRTSALVNTSSMKDKINKFKGNVEQKIDKVSEHLQ